MSQRVIRLETPLFFISRRFSPIVLVITLVGLIPQVFAQSSQVAAEWGLFNQILMIGIAVGVVVFGLLFYALIRYREKPGVQGAQ
jgi:heme/copper-type cytochrome/quinol oxidase subunit 2